jgi:hypothetical protein
LAIIYCYILNTPKDVCSTGAFKAALKLKPSTDLVSAGSITPSSQILENDITINIGLNIGQQTRVTRDNTPDNNKDNPVSSYHFCSAEKRTSHSRNMDGLLSQIFLILELSKQPLLQQ